jgi:hypothetical protein
MLHSDRFESFRLRSAPQPMALKELPMRRPLLALRLLLSILSVSLLVPAADLAWAQNQSPIEQIAAPIFDIAVLHIPASESKILDPRSFSAGLPPILETNRSQPSSQARFFTAPTSYHQLLIGDIGTLNLRQLTGTAESQSSGNYFIGGTPNKLFTFEPGYLKLSNQTINRASDMDYYGRLPFAGPIILRVAQQAEVHPRITRVLKTLHPRF